MDTALTSKRVPWGSESALVSEMMSTAGRSAGSQKRNRVALEVGPQLEAGFEEGGFASTRRRASEVSGASTCGSDAVFVERIHSGIPVLPEARKTEGADCPFNLEGTENRPVRPSDDSCIGFFENDGSALRLGAVSSGPPRSTASPQLARPESYAARHRAPAAHPIQPAGLNTFRRPATQPVDASVGHRLTSRAGVFTTLTWDALQQQMELLQRDEQALLGELRLLRRQYDERVAAAQRGAGAEQGLPAVKLLPEALAEDKMQLALLLEQEARLRYAVGGAPRVASVSLPSDDPSGVLAVVNGATGRSVSASRRTMPPPPAPPPAAQATSLQPAAKGPRQVPLNGQKPAPVPCGARGVPAPHAQAASRGGAAAVPPGRRVRPAPEALPAPAPGAAPATQDIDMGGLATQLDGTLSQEGGGGPALTAVLLQLMRLQQQLQQQ